MVTKLDLTKLASLLETMEPADIRAEYGDALAENPRCEALLRQFEALDDDLVALKTADPPPALRFEQDDPVEASDASPVVMYRRPEDPKTSRRAKKSSAWMVWAVPLAAAVVFGLLWVGGLGADLSNQELNKRAIAGDRSDEPQPTREASAEPANRLEMTAAANEEVAEEEPPLPDVETSISSGLVSEYKVGGEPDGQAEDRRPGKLAEKPKDLSKKQVADDSESEALGLNDAVKTDGDRSRAVEQRQAGTDAVQTQRRDQAAGDAPPEPTNEIAESIPESQAMDSDDLAYAQDAEADRASGSVVDQALQQPAPRRELEAIPAGKERDSAPLDLDQRAEFSSQPDLNQAVLYETSGAKVEHSAWLANLMQAWNQPGSAFPENLFVAGGRYHLVPLVNEPVPLRTLRAAWPSRQRQIVDTTIVRVSGDVVQVRVAFTASTDAVSTDAVSTDAVSTDAASADTNLRLTFKGGRCTQIDVARPAKKGQ